MSHICIAWTEWAWVFLNFVKYPLRDAVVHCWDETFLCSALFSAFIQCPALNFMECCLNIYANAMVQVTQKMINAIVPFKWQYAFNLHKKRTFTKGFFCGHKNCSSNYQECKVWRCSCVSYSCYVTNVIYALLVKK